VSVRSVGSIIKKYYHNVQISKTIFKGLIIPGFLVFGGGLSGRAQLYMTKNGFAGFYSKTPLEDIQAENNQVYAVIDPGKKNLAVTLLVKGFLFPRELMQEHFNENYAESDRFPKASFSGTFTGDFDPVKPGVYPIIIRGTLNFHGVSRNLEEKALLELHQGQILGTAHFTLRPEDFKIRIPSLVRDKIAREIRVDIKIDCNPLK
jgi:hypothetical protein